MTADTVAGSAAPGTARFWDGIAAKYARSPVKNVAAYEHTLERTRAHLSPDDDVLEVGCGTGTTALKLAEGVARYTATDISGEMIAIAEGKAAGDGAANVRFVRSDLDGLAEPAHGAVLAFNVLHLVDDLPSALSRVRNLLRPGGVFVSKTVCMGEMSKVWRLVLPVMRLVGKAPPHVGFLRVAELESAIAAAGFEIVETGTFPPSPPARFVVARRR